MSQSTEIDEETLRQKEDDSRPENTKRSTTYGIQKFQKWLEKKPECDFATVSAPELDKLSSSFACKLVENMLYLQVASLYEAECGNKPADVVFVLDSSSSISRKDFEKQKGFAADVVKNLDIGEEKTRVALFIFSDTVTSQFGLDKHMTSKGILEDINEVHQTGGGTGTDEALAFLREKVFKKEILRPGVPKIAIVLTDGMSQRPAKTKEEATKVNDDLITVFVIGVGSGVDTDELSAIASKPSSHYVYRVDDFDILKSYKDDLTSKTCRAKELQKVEEEKILKACSGKAADVYFALDSSSSISREDFQKQRLFAEDVTNFFDIGGQSTRVGLIQFSDDVIPVFGLNNFTDKESVLTAISKIRQGGGGTLTDEALSYLRENGFVDSQKDSPKVVVMLTDGMSQYPEKTKTQAKLIHNTHVYVFVIGIGFAVDRDELKAIGSDPDEHYVFEIDSFDFLKVIMPQLVLKTCSATPGKAIQDNQPQEVCGNNVAEVVFVLDTSSSITKKDFEKQKNFAKDVVSLFGIGSDKTRVSLILFSYDVFPMFGLTKYGDKASILSHINTISNYGGGTRTDNVLQYVRKAAFAGARSNVPKITILLTDGMSQYPDRTIEEAVLVHDAGISIFVIGIGSDVDAKELLAIAGDDRRMYKVMNFDFLKTIKNDLAMKTCKVEWPPAENVMEDQAADQAPVCSSKRAVDVVFGLDAQWLGTERSTHVYHFISELSDGFNMGDDGVKISVATPRCTKMPNFYLDDFAEKYQISRVLTTIDTTDVLSLFGDLRGRFIPTQGGRMAARKVAVLFATSETERRGDLEREVKMSRYLGLKVIVIAVGDVGKEYLGSLASDPLEEHFINIASLAELEDARVNIVKAVCE